MMVWIVGEVLKRLEVGRSKLEVQGGESEPA